jgi:hypothetical protein
MEPQPFGDCCGSVERATWKKHQKLFSAQAANRIVEAQCGSHFDRQVFEHLVAYPVPVGIVDPLEVIDVCDEQPHLLLGALATHSFPMQQFHDAVAIVNTSQKIMVRPILGRTKSLVSAFFGELRRQGTGPARPSRPGSYMVRTTRKRARPLII